MSGRCLALLLVVLISTGGNTSGLSSKASKNVEIDIQFNPCIGHVCAAGETCKAVVNQRLLQFPVARCVKNTTAGGDNSGCTHVHVGSNLLNCKTEQKWNEIARMQCMFRGGIQSLQLSTVKVQHACYSRTGGKTRFLQADFSCCLTETPSGVNTESATTSTQKDKGDHDPTSKQLPTAFSTTQLSPSNDRDEVGTSSDANVSSVEDTLGVGVFHPFLIAVFVLAVVLAVGLVVACTIARRRARRSKSSSKAPPTVYINPNCDDHSYLKHSNSDTTLLSSPDLLLVEHQY